MRRSTNSLPHWERVRDLEAKQLVGLFSAEVYHTAGGERQAGRREGPGHIKAHKHVVVAEALQNGSAHVDRRGASAIEVDHVRRHHSFLGTGVVDGENAPKSICEDHRHHMRHSRSAIADRPEVSDLCDDDECGALLDEHLRSRYRQSFEDRARDARKSDSVELISNAFCLEVECRREGTRARWAWGQRQGFVKAS